MSVYIDRTPLANVVAAVNDGTVTIRTRLVGATVVADVTEEAPASSRPASKAVLVGLVRGATRSHLDKPRAVGAPINHHELTRECNVVDPATGRRDVEVRRIRTVTYVIGTR